jgi:hypothetical protein
MTNRAYFKVMTSTEGFRIIPLESKGEVERALRLSDGYFTLRDKSIAMIFVIDKSVDGAKFAFWFYGPGQTTVRGLEKPDYIETEDT